MSHFGSDRASLLSGLRTSPRQQQFPTSTHQNQGMSYYQQQQMQMAFYQQQQMELAQQQAALEMQLQLEQMRLQNLALQEQIMLGQVVHATAQAEAVMHHRMEERNVYTAPQKSAAIGGRFVVAQGGVLAERAMARRQAQEEVPAKGKQYQTPAFQRGHHARQSSTSSYLSSSTTPRDPNAATPALILSKPGEAFPVASPPMSDTDSEKQLGHKHSDSESSASTRSSLSSFSHSRDTSEGDSIDSPPSEVVTFEKAGEMGSPKPKLNPFSNVFVPAAATVVLSPLATAVPNVYRAPRSGSPQSAGAMARSKSAAAAGAVAVRQPKGPPSHAEDLDAQNFNCRLRKRAITNIRALGVRATSPPSSPLPGGDNLGFSSLPADAVSPGLMALVQATKAREERARGDSY